MADRTSAELFGVFFEYLAETQAPDEKRAKKMAKWLWEKSRSYDFSNYQMYADDDLVALGLARRDGDEMLYEGDKDF